MQTSELRVGNCYYMVTFPDATMTVPVILTYRYLGQDLGDREDPAVPEHFFRYLPGMVTNEDERSSWYDLYPELFSGWGEPYPVIFAEDKLAGLVTLAGLVEQLATIAARAGPS